MTGDTVKAVCLECGATNLYPLAAEGKKVVCGRCKSVLPHPGTVLEPTPEQAVSLFRNSSLPVLVDFYSMTCGPCHMMNPVVERLARRRAGELLVIKIDVERDQELARGLGVQGVPTFVIIHRGTERDRLSGAVPEEDFAFWVASRA